jgi:SAM-dependent methyltransferase
MNPKPSALRRRERMNWRERRADARRRVVGKYDAAEAQAYGATQGLGWLAPDEEAAYLADLRRVVQFEPGSRVLDAGAGTGVVCSLLRRLPSLELNALEPSPAMLAVLQARPELANVVAVCGYCDEPQDAERFAAGAFDAIVARQLVNGLFDPLVAFRHWHRWLRPGGVAVVIEGLYGRDGWTGRWEDEVDVLPLAATQSTATVPYLLEACGFHVEAVEQMAAVNALPVTRTPRYVVVARKPAA